MVRYSPLYLRLAEIFGELSSLAEKPDPILDNEKLDEVLSLLKKVTYASPTSSEDKSGLFDPADKALLSSCVSSTQATKKSPGHVPDATLPCTQNGLENRRDSSAATAPNANIQTAKVSNSPPTPKESDPAKSLGGPTYKFPGPGSAYFPFPSRTIESINLPAYDFGPIPPETTTVYKKVSDVPVYLF